MGGYALQTDQATQICINPEDMLRLLQEGKIAMPTLEDEDIDDRSKANWFTKSISLIQVSWFILQLLARAIEQKPITTLELYTLGIVTCAILIYGSNWHKPFDVQRPVVLNEIETEHTHLEKISRIGLLSHQSDGLLTDQMSIALISLICIAFSGPHLLGWNFDFSSTVEQWLWRAGSIGCFVLPILLALLLIYPEFPTLPTNDLCFVILFVLYILVRVALFVEMFVSLRSVPAGVYQTPRWSNYIPSFG